MYRLAVSQRLCLSKPKRSGAYCFKGADAVAGTSGCRVTRTRSRESAPGARAHGGTSQRLGASRWCLEPGAFGGPGRVGREQRMPELLSVADLFSGADGSFSSVYIRRSVLSGHDWLPRDNDKPRVCPKCKSPRWDVPEALRRSLLAPQRASPFESDAWEIDECVIHCR